MYLDLLYFPLVKIERQALYNTLMETQYKLRTEILAYGDSPLDPDPYVTPRKPGENVTVEAESWTDVRTRISYKMTYQTVLDVLRGLFGFLYQEGRQGSIKANIIDDDIAPGPEICGTVAIRPYED